MRNHPHTGGVNSVKIVLTTAVSGILPKANGGTGVADLKIDGSGYAVYKA